MKISYVYLIRLCLIFGWICVGSCHHQQDENNIVPNLNYPYKEVLLRNTTSPLGYAIVDTLQQETVLAMGDKNNNGVLINIKKIVHWIPSKRAFIIFHLSSENLFTEIDFISEQNNVALLFDKYDLTLGKLNLSIKDGQTGQLRVTDQNIVLNANTLALIKLQQAQSQVLLKGGRAKAEDDCSRISAALKVSLSVLGCELSIIAAYAPIVALLALAPETGGLSLLGAAGAVAYAEYSALSNCKEAKEAVQNVLNGKCEDKVDEPKDIVDCFGTLFKFASSFAISKEKKYKELADCALPVIDYLRKYINNSSSKISPSSTASAFGDPHLQTFDGLYYDFQGYGEFIAVKSLTDNFEIQVRQEQMAPFLNRQVTLNTGIAINTGNDKVCLYPNVLYINNKQYGIGNGIVPLTKGSASASNGLLTIVTDNEDVIKINTQSFSLGYLDYNVTLNNNRKGNVQGLLGNFDGTAINDTKLQTGGAVNSSVFGELYPIYADSWRVSQDKSLFIYANGATTATYTKKDFPKSQTELDLVARQQAETICRQKGVTDEPYLSACIMDVALSGSDQYVLSAANAQESKLIINNFSTPKFTSFVGSDLIPFGNADIADGSIYLTHNKEFQVGAVYKKYKVDISTGFETTFDFSMTDPGGIRDARNRVGADGVVFVIQDFSGKNVPLAGGTGLGYDGLSRSLVVEFDTYNNGSFENQDDISLNTQGVSPNSLDDSRTLIKAQTRQMPTMNDGKVHNVVIRYTKKSDGIYKLEVFFDKDASPYLTADNINIQKTIGAYGTGVYIGFTSATGYSWENHIIHNWSYKPL